MWECRALSKSWCTKGWETGWNQEPGNLGMTQCMVYAVTTDNYWLWHEEIERDDLTLCFEVIAELRTRKRKIIGDEANHHERLRVEGILCASHFTIPDMAFTSPDHLGNKTQTMSAKLNQACHTPEMSHLLVSFICFPSLFPKLSFSCGSLTSYQEPQVQSTFSCSPCHDHEFPLSTASTNHCFSSLHLHYYE